MLTEVGDNDGRSWIHHSFHYRPNRGDESKTNPSVAFLRSAKWREHWHRGTRRNPSRRCSWPWCSRSWSWGALFLCFML